MFDINSIQNMVIEGANSTQVVPVPEGEYRAVVKAVDAREVTKQDGTRVPVVRVTWVVDAQNLPGTNEVTQDIWLDLTPQGTIDMSEGKNVALGRLREAVGQNKPGKPWSFQQLVGQAARILVTHRTTDSGEVFGQVRKVTAL